MGPEPTLGRKYEKMISQWVLAIAKRGFPVAPCDLLTSVQKLVQELNLSNPFKSDRPGKKWLKLFLKRNPEVAKRTPEKLTSSRSSVTEENLRKWFDNVKVYADENGLPLDDPSRLFNMDESGFMLCPKGEKVLGIKGQRNVYEVCSANEKENVTVLLGVSAAGSITPPLVVYAGQRLPKGVGENVPGGWAVAKSEKGWITGETFYEYITNVFHPWLVENKIQFPVVSFVDGHSSHLTYHLSEFCAANKIEVIALYPNATHIIQPLYVSVFGPLKKKWARDVRRWKIENQNITVNKVMLPKLLDGILKQDLKKSSIINGFRTCGLYPFTKENVDYSKCLYSRQVSSVAKDIRHTHVEKLLGEEVVLKFRNRGPDTISNKKELYKLWEKSLELCSLSSEIEPQVPAASVVEDASTPPNPSFSEDTLESHVPAENPVEDASTPPIPSFSEDPLESQVPAVNAINATAMHVPTPAAAASKEFYKILSPETGGEDVPSPFKRALVWPGSPKKKIKCRLSLEMIMPVVTSQQYRSYKLKASEKKKETERLKAEKKQKREEKKQQLELMKKALALKKTRRVSETSSSDSSCEMNTVESGDSPFDETNDDNNTKTWTQCEKKVGEFVAFTYDAKTYLGQIVTVTEDDAIIRAMEPCGKNWKWPEKTDELRYTWEDILGKIETPTAISTKRKIFAIPEMDKFSDFV